MWHWPTSPCPERGTASATTTSAGCATRGPKAPGRRRWWRHPSLGAADRRPDRQPGRQDGVTRLEQLKPRAGDGDADDLSAEANVDAGPVQANHAAKAVSVVCDPVVDRVLRRRWEGLGAEGAGCRAWSGSWRRGTHSPSVPPLSRFPAILEGTFWQRSGDTPTVGPALGAPAWSLRMHPTSAHHRGDAHHPGARPAYRVVAVDGSHGAGGS